MIVGLYEQISLELDYVIEDIKETKGINGHSFDYLKKGLGKYILGELNENIHQFICSNYHMFIVYDGLRELIIQRKRSYERQKQL